MRVLVLAGLVAGAVVGVASVAPAAADNGAGTVTITFDKRAWRAITEQMVVTPTGRAEPAPQCCPCGPPESGQQVSSGPCCACREDNAAAGCETAGAATGSFTMPGVMRKRNAVAVKGGLSFSRADASLRIRNVVVDFGRKKVSATLDGLGPRRNLLMVSNVKGGSPVRANLSLAKGEAAVLNGALKTDVFTPRMRIGWVVYTAD